MKKEYTLEEIKIIYSAEDFCERAKAISNTPAKAIGYVYAYLWEQYKGKPDEQDGTDEDPFGILLLLQWAEEGDEYSLSVLLVSAQNKDDEEVMRYWGEKAIENCCPKPCAVYMAFLMEHNIYPERMLAAYRWAACAEDDSLKASLSVAGPFFTIKYPESYEVRIAAIAADSEESELQEFLVQASKRKDYPVCFLIIFILRERGIAVDRNQLKEFCTLSETESYYYFLIGEKLPENKDFDERFIDGVRMNDLAKKTLGKGQKEFFVRVMYEYCEAVLDGIMDPMTVYALNAVMQREEYLDRISDAAVIVRAGYASAVKRGYRELMDSLLNVYRQLLLQDMLSHKNELPPLEKVPDKMRLKKALYHNVSAVYPVGECPGGSADFAGKQSVMVEPPAGEQNDKEEISAGKRDDASEDIAGEQKDKEEPAEEENGEKGNPVREQNDTEIKSCQPTFCGTESVPAGDLNNPENVLWNECSQMSEGVAMVEFEDGEAGEYVFLFPVSVGDRVSVNGLHIGKIGKVCKLGTCENSLELPEITAVVQKSSVSSESVQSSATEPYLKKRKITKKQSIIIVCAIALVVILLATLLPLCLRQDTSGLVIRNLKIDGNVITWDEAPDADSYMVVLDGARFDGQYYDPSDAKRKNVNSPNCELPFNEGESYRVSVSAVIEEGGHTYPYRVTYRYYGTVTFEYQPEYFTVTWKNIDGNNSSASKRLEPNQKFDFTYDNVDKGDPNDDTQMYCQGWFSDVALTKEVTEEFVLKQDITLYGKWQKDYLQMTDGVLVDVKTFSEEVSVPAAITAIDDYAFYGCGTLKRITIPSNVQTIGRYAFKDCTALEIVSISEGVQIVGERAFENCTALREIHIAQSVKSFGSAAFIGCENLENVYIKSIADWCLIGFEDFTGNPLSFAKNLYADGLITDLIVPETTDKIGDYAFSGFEGLRSILISDSVESIGIYAFSGCVNLTGVTVGRGVRSIGMRAFSECGSLKSIFIPDSVSEMGEYVFEKNNITVNCQAEAEPHEWDDDWDKAFWTVSSEYEVNVVWGAKDPDTLKTYVFHSNGGTEVDPLVDDAVYTCPVTTNGDMAFMGWYDNAALDGKAIAFPYTGQATEFYAKWETRDGSSFAKALILEINEFGSGWYIYTSTTEMYFMFTLPSSYTGAEVYSITVTDGSSIIGINVDYAVYDASGREINYFVSKGKYYLSNGETYYLCVSLREGTKINVSIEK